MANQYRVKTGVKLYTQVLEQVKSMIAQGVYKKGDLLPSEKELIEMMGVSRITVRKAKVSAGAGFIVALTGDIMTMPGLPKRPAAERIDVDETGKISGLF